MRNIPEKNKKLIKIRRFVDHLSKSYMSSNGYFMIPREECRAYY
tara:strand:+ start:183 stop:314 length:132 start_codon:yes stop_codon:yes gene_type:complete